MDSHAESWELSKENIQPLRQGRKFAALRKALTPGKDDNLEKQKQIFETELRTYEGDDPIELWLQYIEWVEQNYPKGGHDGNVYQLLERCIAVMQRNQKYQNDMRYLKVCLKYANMSSNSLEIFNHMYEQNIGCSLANFYSTWAWTLEQLGDFQRANHVLKIGIQRRADPIETLVEDQKRLHLKLAKAVLEEELQISEMLSTAEDERGALAALKPKGSKHRAPINRTGPAKLDLKVRLPPSLSGPRLTSNAQASKGNIGTFQIFTDESNMLNENNAARRPKEPVVMPMSTKAKENEKMAGKWSKVKHVPKRSALVSHHIPPGSAPEFPIHEDESSSISKPVVVLPKDSNVLSCKKSSWAPPIAIFEPPDPKKKPMYCKTKIYGGNTEFSFEEIRAAKWLTQQKLQKEKAAQKGEMDALRLKVLELDENLSQLKITYAMNASEPSDREALRLKVLQIDQQLAQLKAAVSAKSSVPDKISEGNSRYYLESAPKSVISRHLKTYATSHSNLRMVEQPASQGASSLDQQKTSFLTADAAVPNQSVMPSPTVHTREAYQEIRALWEGTIFHTSSNENTNNVSQNDYLGHARKDPSFSVFCDPTQTLPLKNAVDLAKVLHQAPSERPEVREMDEMQDENKENVPADGYIQISETRHRAGILQPSIGIPCNPLQELDDEMADGDDDDLFEGIYPLRDNDDGKDFTLPPLCNTANFASHPSLVCSTPFVQNKMIVTEPPQTSSDDFAKPPEIPTVNDKRVPNQRAPCDQDGALRQDNTSAALRGNFVPHNLSVIVETSRENTKSSSSSSSSHSTVPSLNSLGKSLRDSTGRTSRLALSQYNQSCPAAEEDKE